MRATFIIGAVLALSLGFMAAPHTAAAADCSAAHISQLQQQISALLNQVSSATLSQRDALMLQITDLQTQIGLCQAPTPPTPQPSCSAIEAQIASLREQAAHASGIQLTVLNLQIQLAQLQLAQCNLPPEPTDNGPKGTLIVYSNDHIMYTSSLITQTAALANCKLNSTNAAAGSYYCTWNGKEIFRRGQETSTGAVTVKVLTPNGGEKFKAGSGDSMTLRWSALKFPKGATVCGYLVKDGSGERFLWGECYNPRGAGLVSGSISGKFIRNSGYDLGPGLYRAEVDVSAKPDGSGKDGALIGTDKSDGTVTLTGSDTGDTSPFLSYALVNKAVDPGESWTEGLDLSNFVLQIKNSMPLSQSITFPTNCWWSYRIYDVATGKVTFDLKSVQQCLSPQKASSTTFVLKSGDTKSLEFSHLDSTFHLVPGHYRMVLDVNSTRPATNAASFVFGINAKTAAAKPVCAVAGTTSHHIGTSWNTIAIGDSITITWTSANASYAILPGGDKGPTSGVETYTPDASKTYTYKFVGPGGEVTCSQSVTVVGGDAPTTVATSTASDTLSATPVSGIAPLQVIFSGIANKKQSCGGGARTLAFGDGATYQISFPADLCKTKSWSVSHTYQNKGSYSAVLYGGWLVGKEAITRVGITVAPAFVESATTGTSGSTGGTTTGATPNPTNKTPDAPTQYETDKNVIHQTPNMLESAAAYLAIQSALEAIMAQLKELAQ